MSRFFVKQFTSIAGNVYIAIGHALQDIPYEKQLKTYTGKQLKKPTYEGCRKLMRHCLDFTYSLMESCTKVI